MHRAVVIGGGPAGLVAAIALRHRGWNVTVVDGNVPPIDKACGEGLLPEGVAALLSLGIYAERIPHAAFRGIRFVSGEHSTEAEFNPGRGLGIRRTDLHALLVSAAEHAGIALLWGEVALNISNNSVNLRSCALPAGLIIGADGARSRVREWAGLSAGNSSHRFGFRRHFAIAPWTDKVEVHWCDLAQVFITPLSAEQIGVAWLCRSPQTTLAECLKQLPALQARLRGVLPCSAKRGCLTRMQRPRRVTRGNIALVGEASGSVDAISGDGLTLAFQQAIALAECLSCASLESYNRRHSAIMRRPRAIARALLAMDRSRMARELAMRAFARNPQLFRRLLNLHTAGERSFTSPARREASSPLEGSALSDPAGTASRCMRSSSAGHWQA